MTTSIAPTSADSATRLSIEEFRADVIRKFKRCEIILADKKAWELEIEMCKRSASHFINSWCFTYDPRYKPFHFPFKLWPYQNTAINWLTDRYENNENGLIEKSRDMGATWCWVAWLLHRWLFSDAYSALVGSRKAELVDDNSLDSIFGKLRYLLFRLPKFLKPHLNDRQDKHMSLTNPWSGNEILGESANLNFGRQGRYRSVFITEFAFVEHSEAIWSAVSETSNNIVVESNPNGKGNQFAFLRHETPIKTLTLHWTLHPRKDQAWYEKKCEQMQPWQVAQELDISYERSKFGKIYRRFERQWHVSEEIIPCKPVWEQYVTWDFGRAGMMSLANIQVSPTGDVEVWNHFELDGWDIDFFVPISAGKIPTHYPILGTAERKKVDTYLAKLPKDWVFQKPIHVGDHAGTAKTANSTRSCRDAIREAGFEFQSSGKQTYDWRYLCFDELLMLQWNDRDEKWRARFQVSGELKRVIDCINNASWNSDDLHSDTIKPKTDEYFHTVSALEFFAINRFPVSQSGGVTTKRWR